MPWRWHEAAFTNLVAEGGHRVSAKREANATTWLCVVAGAEGELRIRDNFGVRAPQWNVAPVGKVGDDFVFTVQAGTVIEATLPKPAATRPAPANAWLDDVPLPPKDPGVHMCY